MIADGDIDALLDAAAAGGSGPGSTPSGGLRIPIRNPGWQPGNFKISNQVATHAADYAPGGAPQTEFTYLDPDSAAVAIYGWDEKEQRAFAKRAWYVGLLDSPQDLAGAFGVWQQAVKQAGNFSMAGKPMDPRDVMELLAAGDPSAHKRLSQRGPDGEPRTFTQKSRSIDLTDPTTARALIQQAGLTAVGRELSDAEVRTLTRALNDKQRANPNLTTQTTKQDADGKVTSQTSESSGGIDPQAFLSAHFDADPEAAENQAATYYFPLLMQALGSPAGLGG